MFPVLIRIGDIDIGTHDAFVVLGVIVAVAVFRLETRRRRLDDPRLWTIAGGGILLGAIFARLGTGWRYLAEDSDPSLLGLWLHGGKTVVGGLAGAYLGVLLTKRIVGYRHRTGDVFAPAVALGIATGRIGCFLTEPIGTPTSMPWGIAISPELGSQIPNCPQCAEGRPLHPSLLYEIAALLALYGLVQWLRPRIDVPGELFKVFLLGYGTFRFLLEFVRGHDTFALGLTGTQIFLLATMPVLCLYFIRQLARDAYHRPATASPAALAGNR